MTTRTKGKYDIIVLVNNHSTTITSLGNVCTLRQAIKLAKEILIGNHFQQTTNYSSYYIKDEFGTFVKAQFKYGLKRFVDLNV